MAKKSRAEIESDIGYHITPDLSKCCGRCGHEAGKDEEMHCKKHGIRVNYSRSCHDWEKESQS